MGWSDGVSVGVSMGYSDGGSLGEKVEGFIGNPELTTVGRAVGY